jgi:carbon storage regulator
MLVLTRKAEQKIRIGNDIVITVLKVQGDQVSIGIEAPKKLQIVREELLFEDLSQTAARVNKKSVVKNKNFLTPLEINDD